MGSQISLTMSLVMIGLFVIAIFSFVVGFQIDNHSTQLITSDPNFNSVKENTGNTLDTLDTTVESSSKSILETTVEPGSDVSQSSAPYSVGLEDYKNIVLNMIDLPRKAIFGSGAGFAVFFTIFGAIIAFLFVLYVIKTWRGNP